ncbi:MAG: hypothetical protein AAF600_10930 [Bacteroidota bacterium]
MPLEKVKDMTWAEFLLRSFQYWEDRKNEAKLFREVSYRVYCVGHMFGKGKPLSINKFWPLEDEGSHIDESMLNAMQEAWNVYEQEKNGNT